MSIESVQTFGRKKTATAVAFVKKGTGLIKVNGVPISLLQPEILKLKTFEPVLLIGTDKFSQVSQCTDGMNRNLASEIRVQKQKQHAMERQ